MVSSSFVDRVQIAHSDRPDVDTVPINGTWFQLVCNGAASINDGPNGLQKLDTVVQMAEEYGLYVILSLTNNWYPLPLLNSTAQSAGTIGTRDVTTGTNNSLPRNYLSNDYGQSSSYPLKTPFLTWR